MELFFKTNVDFGEARTLLILADETERLANMAEKINNPKLANAYRRISNGAILTASEILLIETGVENLETNENLVDKVI